MSDNLKPRRTRATPEQMAERHRLHECRVEFVADMMRDLKYRTGVSCKDLEREWDLPRVAVAAIVSEASKRVRAELTDPDRVLSKVSRALDKVIDDAILSGDRMAVIRAAQVWAQVSGAGAATRVQVSQDLSTMTTEQIAARKAELIARLAPKPGDGE